MEKSLRKMYFSRVLIAVLALVLLLGCQTMLQENVSVFPYSPPHGLYFVDAHSQVDKLVDPQSSGDELMTPSQIRGLIIQKMSAVNVASTILAPRRGQSYENILEISNYFFWENGIYPAIATKGNYTLNLRQLLRSGKFHALGEVLLYHAEKPNIEAPEVINYPSDPWVQNLYKVAKKEGWPFIVHIEDAAMPNHIRKTMYRNLCQVGFNIDSHNVGSLEERRCRSLYRSDLDMTDHPVVLIHMAQLSSKHVKSIITRNSNVYFMTSHSNPVINARSDQPWINMFSNGVLKSEWFELIKAHPDRFIFALDNVTQKHWTVDYEGVVELWRNALAQLPDNVAHLVAHGNAERLWKLTPLYLSRNPATIQP